MRSNLNEHSFIDSENVKHVINTSWIKGGRPKKVNGWELLCKIIVDNLEGGNGREA